MVTVRDDRHGLDPDLLELSSVTADRIAGLELEVPLRAFGAKMVELIEMAGTGDFDPGPALTRMLVQEKATADLKRIERFARSQAEEG